MRKFVASGLAAALFAGTLGAFLAPALADAPTTAAAGNPGAARISLVSGSVAVERSDTHDNVAAAVNAPVLDGDALTTGAQARAEVQFDGRSILRAGENAQVRFASLDPTATTVQLAAGTIGVDLLDGATIMPEVDTPSISIRPDGIGRYRVTVSSDGETYLTVRAGSADVITPQGTRTVGIGATLTAQGPAANPTIDTQDAVAFDGFDSFSINRDAELNSALASNNAYGSYDAQDLGAYGQWVYDPAYGEVWVPDNQTADWAPYRDGQWAYEGPYYGYTWISYEPWGWAPYHYGRWAFIGGGRGWGWIAPRGRTAWSPGLVAFFGFGGGVSLGLSFGNVGWVALGPGDPYRPWWGPNRYAFGYGGAGIDRYTNYRRGATSVSADRWKQGDFRHNDAVNPESVHGSVGFDGRVPMRPTAQNMRFSSATLPSNLANRHFDSAAFARGGGDRPAMSARTTPAYASSRAQSYGSGDAWSRFSDSRGAVDRDQQRTYDASRSYSQSARSYDSTRNYSSQRSDYSQSQRSYSQPQRSDRQQSQRSGQQSQRSSQSSSRSSSSSGGHDHGGHSH